MSTLRAIREKEERLAIGLMSGISADGIDAALVNIRGSGENVELDLAAFDTLSFSDTVRTRIQAVQGPGPVPLKEVVLLSSYLGELYAHAASHVCRRASINLMEVDFVGCHGQTLYHQPEKDALPGFEVNGTLQAGNPAILAERTGLVVVSDFRSRDMAVGGQGGPLSAYLDYLLYNHRSRGRVALNIGGLANVTAMGADAPFREITAFDTGPGNCLIDLAISHFTKGKQAYDKDGLWAQQGNVDEKLLAMMMQHPYLQKPPPKTADRDLFGRGFFNMVLKLAAGMRASDVVASITEYTVRSIVDGIRRFVPEEVRFEEIIVSGGGAKNPVITEGLGLRLPTVAIVSGDEYRITSRAKEAVLMAFLANETVMGLPGNVPSATGAKKPAVLGSITMGIPLAPENLEG